MNNLEAALAYIQPNENRPALRIFPCRSRDKKPCISEWQHMATTEEETIRKWWRIWPDANIALFTQGFVVLDIDEHDKQESGHESLHELENQYEPLPETWIVETPTGGEHYYFRSNDPRLRAGTRIAPGIDFRGSGGYVLIPPSIHPNGRQYEWEAAHEPKETPLADLPEWLHDLILSKISKAASGGETTEIPETITSGQRNDLLFRAACSLRAKGFTDTEIFAALDEMNKNRCCPPLTDKEIKTIVESAAKYARGSAGTRAGEADPNKYKPQDFSDSGNAERFTLFAKDRLLWCDAIGWLFWDGKRWNANEHEATGLAIDFASKMLEEALEEYKGNLTTDPETGKVNVPENSKRFLNHAQRTRNANAIQSILTLSKARLHINADRLDSEWYCLNTDAGIVDLRSGQLLPHDPKMLCTKIAPFIPSEDGKQMWSEFLDTITEGDTEYQEFLQVKTGSYAFGRIFHEGVDFWIGAGRNGKSTFANAISKVLGDYSGAIDSEVLTTDRQSKGAALATLRGRRFVTCGELEEGQRLSVSTLKKLASTDKMVIEAKYKQPEIVTPSHHVILFSNFLPRVGSTDAGTWRRIAVLPFSATMPTGSADIPNYAERLVEKAGGAILNWIIQGAIAFHKADYHFTVPDVVTASTENYRSKEDWISLFIEERCIITEPNTKTRASELYNEYKNFALSTGDYCRRGSDFTKALEGAGFRRVIIKGKPYWYGIAIEADRSFVEPPQARQYY